MSSASLPRPDSKQTPRTPKQMYDILRFLHSLPPLLGIQVKLKEALAFLDDTNSIGCYELQWECPKTKALLALRFLRLQKEIPYYRESCPMYLQVFLRDCESFPLVNIPLETEAARESVKKSLKAQLLPELLA